MGDTLNQEALQQAHMDIAILKTELGHMRREVDDLRGALSGLTDAVNTLNITLAEARGGWKFMVFLGGAGATFGAGLTWLIQSLTGKH